MPLTLNYLSSKHSDRCPFDGFVEQRKTPQPLRVGGYWHPRGGIPIDVFWQTGKLPKGMWVPDQGAAPYRGRG